MSAGHAGGRKKKGHEEEHENSERWMVTYADMLTLLLVLFIVLYAMGQANTSKFDKLKASLASAFNNGQQSVLTGGNGVIGTMAQPGAQQKATTPIVPKLKPALGAASTNLSTGTEQLTAAKRESDQFSTIISKVHSSLKARGLAADATFSVDERGLTITILTDSLVFPGNSAELQKGGAVIFDAVIPPLKTVDNQIQVDGHTNQANVSTYPYPSGWELSTARASSVVRYLVSHGGISAGRLSAVGYSDQRPLLPASDPRSVTRNRRVDIVVLSKLSPAERASLPSITNTTGS